MAAQNPFEQFLLTKKCDGDDTWIIKDKLENQGVESVMRLICCGDKCEYVIKKANPDIKKEQMESEIKIHQDCSSAGLCTQIVDSFVHEGIYYIITEKMDMTLAKLLSVYTKLQNRLKNGDPEEKDKYNEIRVDKIRLLLKVIGLIEAFHDMGYSHSDLHFNNVMVKVTKKEGPLEDIILSEKFEDIGYVLKLIDFGRSTTISEDPPFSYDTKMADIGIGKLAYIPSILNAVSDDPVLKSMVIDYISTRYPKELKPFIVKQNKLIAEGKKVIVSRT